MTYLQFMLKYQSLPRVGGACLLNFTLIQNTAPRECPVNLLPMTSVPLLNPDCPQGRKFWTIDTVTKRDCFCWATGCVSVVSTSWFCVLGASSDWWVPWSWEHHDVQRHPVHGPWVLVFNWTVFSSVQMHLSPKVKTQAWIYMCTYTHTHMHIHMKPQVWT